MPHVQEIGTRVELVPMDGHCQNISVGLYREVQNGVPVYRVHTYSIKSAAAARLVFIRQAMTVLGGLEETGDSRLRFPCGDPHLAACRRAFLEACKLETGAKLAVRPLKTIDRKSGLEILATSVGTGAYTVSAHGASKDADRRISVVVNGLAKLGEMTSGDGSRVRFGCGTPHDALVGLLLIRAPNVRAILSEEEAAATRGVLAAPSQQR